MPKVSLQLHITQTEMIDFLRRISAEKNLLVFHIHHPFGISCISEWHSKLTEITTSSDNFITFSLIGNSRMEEATSKLDFIDRNEGAVIIEFGNTVGGRIFETFVSSKAVIPSEITLGKQVTSELKKLTDTGGYVFNRNTGVRVFDRRVRYTKGVKELAINGTIVQFLPGVDTFADLID